jgi:hypothetical protein
VPYLGRWVGSLWLKSHSQDHSTFRPKIFEVANGDYLAFRELTLSVVIQDPAAFLLLVAGAAEDIALRCKKAESKQAIVYNEKALSIINNRMQVPKMFISDGAIAACTIMAGYQVSLVHQTRGRR